MKQHLLIISLVTLLTFSGFAQEKDAFVPRMGLGFVPQYSISGGMRFDIDRSLSKTSNQWLIVSPEVFMVTGNRHNHNIKELYGFGLDIKHRIYLKANTMKPLGFYAQYGIMFQYFSIKDNRQYTELYTDNGVEYYRVAEGEINTNLYKFGGNFHFGYQWLIGDKVYFDLYTGAGIRISHNSHEAGLDTWYNNSWVDYGYSGTLLDGGFRVGFYF